MEEWENSFEQCVRGFFGDVMAAGQRMSADRIRDPTPLGQGIETSLDRTVLAPEDLQGARDPAPGLTIDPVMLEIDRCRRPVVLAQGLNRCRIAQTALILRHRLRIKYRKSRVPAPHGCRHVGLRIGLNQSLGPGRWLDQKKPVPVARGKFAICCLIHGQRGCDIEQRHALNTLRMIERQSVCRARTAVMRKYPKALKTQGAHDLDLIPRHGPKALLGVVGLECRFVGISVPTQVREDDSELLRQARGHAVPECAGLRMSVQQEQRRAMAGPQDRNGDRLRRPCRPIRHPHPLLDKAREQLSERRVIDLTRLDLARLDLAHRSAWETLGHADERGARGAGQ